MYPLDLKRSSLLGVDERGGKEKDETCKGQDAEDREKVAAEVGDVGSDKIGVGGNVADGNVGSLNHHLSRRGGLESTGGGCEGGKKCREHKTQRQSENYRS